MRAVVVGGGIAGLSAALDLVDGGAEVTLVDAGTRPGGKIRTERVDGFTIEHGPDSFVTYKPGMAALADRLGLGDDVVGVTEPRVVHLRRRGRMLRMPEGMGLILPTRLGPFARTSLFTWPQKLRAGLDLVLPRSLGPGDQAIGAFLRHRLGAAVVERLADPLFGGIYGTSVEHLSIDAVLPQLRQYSDEHRSLVLASLRSGRRAARSGGARPGSPFRTLGGGLDRIVDAALDQLRAQPRYDERLATAAVAVTTDDGGRSVVRLVTGEELAADAVVLATPAPVTAALVADELPDAASALREIPHVSTAVVTLGYVPGAFEHPPTGHGFLDASARDERRPSFSGCTFTSGKWPGRAPRGATLIRAFLPDRSAELLGAADEEIYAVVERDLREVLGPAEPPLVRRIARWEGLMPTYTVGHPQRLAAIDEALADRPAWHLAGASYRGVGLPDCVASGRAAAAAALTRAGVP